MTDRELLEAAAKAAGHYLEFQDGWNGMPALAHINGNVWAPLTNLADRYRLMQQLKISVDYQDCCAWSILQNGSLRQAFWGGDHGDEAHAILRVAAAIGAAK